MARKSFSIASFTIASILAVTIAGAAVLPVYNASRTRAAVARLVASHPGLRVGSVAVDPLGGHLVLRDVGYVTRDIAAHVGEIRLPLAGADVAWVGTAEAAESNPPATIAPPPPAAIPSPSTTPPSSPPPVAVPAARTTTVTPAGGASAFDVTITSGATTYAIKAIDLAASTLTGADLTALFDAKDKAALEARLKGLNAASLKISGVTVENAGGSGAFRAALADVLLTNIVAGRIGAATAAGATASALDPDAVGTTLKTGAIQASGVDLAFFVHLLGAVRKDDAEPLAPLLESLSVRDIVAGDSHGDTLAIATITQKNLAARPLKYDLKSLAETATGTDAERGKAVFDDITGSYAIGALGVEKIAFTDTGPDGVVTFGVASIAISDLKNRLLGALAVRGVALAAPVSHATLASLDVKNVLIPLLAPPPGTDAVDRMLSDSLPPTSFVDFNTITADLTRKSEDGAEKTARFTVKHVGTASEREPGKGAFHGAMAIDDVVFDAAMLDLPSFVALREIGYGKVDFSAALAVAYDQSGETLSIPKLVVSGTDMGSVTIGLELANVGKGIFSSRQAVVRATALAALLKRVDLAIVNQGLIDKLIAWKARMDGKPVAAVRGELVDFVGIQLPASLGDSPAVQNVGAEIAKFIAEPKTLHISAVSREGLGIADMALIHGPDDLIERLDIKAEANK
jgi:hypothetical protein